ncbi:MULTISPECIES: hypothetical protein [unclassified Mesorhizobium]|uniref:hypothetical protein n=1 Tax=unclassified Mesorhizobium TaxID=325217 RepID=UPI00333CDBA2
MIWPAEVMLISRRHPDAKSCSATGTAKEEPTAQPNDAKRLAIQFELVKDGMIAGPARRWAGAAFFAQPAHYVAVRIKDTHRRHAFRRQAFLPPRLAKHVST